MSANSHDSLGFRELTHLIPTPGLERRRPPRFEPLILKIWVVVPTALLMIGFAIALEVMLSISDKNNGFHVPPEKTGLFKIASTQFLTSFFPVLFVGPLVILWLETDYLLKWYQPYVLLSQGGASAEDCLLLDYLVLGRFFSFFASIKHKDLLVLASTTTALFTYFLQPLAGATLQIRSVPNTQGGATVTSIREIGLSPNFPSLEGFVASAGFVESAVYNSFPDPPFIDGGWAAAEFTFPTDPLINGSVTVITTGIRTSPNCVNPGSLQLSSLDPQNYSITSASPDGCSRTVTFNPSLSVEQYGVINVPNCGNATDILFEPVMFWFFHVAADGTPLAQTVFCQPTIEAANIVAIANLNDGSLANVTVLTDYTTPNNVTGPPLSGQAFNAVMFNASSNPFIHARAIATSSSVSTAIFRLASQQPDGPDSVFADPNGFLGATIHVYTQHLSLSGKSVYFIPANETFPAVITSLQPRLFVEGLPARLLSSILLGIGAAGLAIHFAHRHARRSLYLTCPPGSIAAVVSMTARSGWGELLVPYDDERGVARKLRGLRFSIDQRTGAIVADRRGGGRGRGDEDEDDGTETVKLGYVGDAGGAGGGAGGKRPPEDAVMAALLGMGGSDSDPARHRSTPSFEASSSLSSTTAAARSPLGEEEFNPYDTV